ncbi:MAG: 7-carboxy-7-deazaguanine synthase QueE, partial [Gammaproteobacteria bacterium]
MSVASPRLRITEIFYSLQGESSLVGLPTVFIRLTGCPLRCGYCDTTYSFSGGEWQSLEEILAAVKQYKVRHVCVTGGEPLAQKACHDLLVQLCDQGYVVSLETSGAMDIKDVDHRVIKVMDIKTPGSGEVRKNLLENINALRPHDEVKFVICDRDDYDWAKTIVAQYGLDRLCQVFFSPVHGQVEPAQLA